jgi:hypothetical protein
MAGADGHEQATEAATPVAVPAAAPAIVTPGTGAERMLALQRTAGNRAVSRLVAANATGVPLPARGNRALARALAASQAPAVAVARDPVTVKEYVHERTITRDDVSWTASFDVDFDSDSKECRATIRIRLVPDGGISDDDVEWTKVGVISRFSLLWDSRYSFHEHRSWLPDRDWLFRPRIEFVDDGEHETVHLHPGKGDSNRTNWYLLKPEYNEDPSKGVPAMYGETEHAHEVSHQMGLLDEYEDLGVPDRKVYKDHSLMGDYASEGYWTVTLHPRHGERMAKIIGKATDRDLTSKMLPADVTET